MKYSAVAISALAVAVSAKPAFLNSSFEVTEGKPFTLKYSGCDSGCTIILEDGPSNNLNDVKTLTTDASGDSTDVTLSGLPSGDYAFKIVDNSDKSEYNYSSQFPYKGTAAASSTTEASSTASSTTASSTTASSTTESSSASSTSASSTSATTPSGSSTSSAQPTSTSQAPDSGAVRIDSSFALIAGAIAAMAYIN